MASAWFGPCPHLQLRPFLSGRGDRQYGETRCPRCKVAITVDRATFLMADYSRPVPYARERKPS